MKRVKRLRINKKIFFAKLQVLGNLELAAINMPPPPRQQYYLNSLRMPISKSQNDNKLKSKDIVTLCISIIAILMSAYTFIENNFLHQHVLKTSVVSINPTKDSLSCTILIVNSGKSYETLYSARFIFSDNLNNGGGSLSHESIGPFVIPPNQAIISKLTTKMPDIKELKEDGTIPKASMNIHIGVLFDIIDKKGNLPEDGKIFKFTQLAFDSSGEQVGARPMKGDNEGMIDLF